MEGKVLQDLARSGTKNELVAKDCWLLPDKGENIEDVSEEEEASTKGDCKAVETTRAPVQPTEMELMRLRLLEKEKEMTIREANLKRRELEVMRVLQANQVQQPTRPETTAVIPKPIYTNITHIAALVTRFCGTQNNFETWRRQLRLVRDQYRLQDDASRILVVWTIGGHVLNWFHSRPEHIELPIETLLDQIGSLFYTRTIRQAAKHQFEKRTWHHKETFVNYLIQKVILANHLFIDQKEIIDYVIDGIPDPILRNQALLQQFMTNADLLEAFDGVTLQPALTPENEGSTSGNQGHQKSICPKVDKSRCQSWQYA